MADAAVVVLAQHPHSVPLLAHLEELRKRIIFSVVGVLVEFTSPRARRRVGVFKPN
jgi:Sec-independent protein secretion pathway component TatC